jgi:hypothetical protein
MGDFQLTMPPQGGSLGGRSPYGRIHLMTGQLQIDPELAALMSPVPFYFPSSNPDAPPILNIMGALKSLADPIKPSIQFWGPMQLGGPIPIIQPRTGLPWSVPNPAMRTATSSDVTAAVLAIPSVNKAVTQVEGMAKAQLSDAWTYIKQDPVTWPWAGAFVLSAGFIGYNVLNEKNPSFKIDKTVKLDPLMKLVRLPVPGLSVEFKYDGDFRTLVSDPRQAKDFGGIVKLDLAQLIPALK